MNFVYFAFYCHFGNSADVLMADLLRKDKHTSFETNLYNDIKL